MKETKRKSFSFFRSYYDVFNMIEKREDKLKFLEALLDKQFLGENPVDLKGQVKFAWISQVNSIDSQVKGWEDKTGLKLPLSTPPSVGVYTTPSVGGKNTPSLQEKEKEKEKEKGGGNEKISFDDFWDLYDHKVGSKPKAKTKFDKLSLEVQTKIMSTLPAFIKSISEKRFQPHATTYLNNERWQDEITSVTKPRFVYDPNDVQ